MRRAVELDADCQLTVKLVIDGARSVVAVRGEIDLATALAWGLVDGVEV